MNRPRRHLLLGLPALSSYKIDYLIVFPPIFRAAVPDWRHLSMDQNFLDLLQCFERHKVKFLVIGFTYLRKFQMVANAIFFGVNDGT